MDSRICMLRLSSTIQYLSLKGVVSYLQTILSWVGLFTSSRTMGKSFFGDMLQEKVIV